MKQVSVTLSTYTADVSGVCSALYELGGMVVIHDPSGCNSTYNTHDEPRWYDMDSLIFISGLSQMDAIMGNDDKFINDIVRAAKELKPRFIALVRTPIPLMTGTDFEGIARVIEKQTQIPVFYFPTSGMHSYVSGAGMALETVARELVLPTNANGHFKENGIEIENVSNELSVADTKKQNQQKLNQSEQKQIENTESKQSNSKIKINILGATPLDFSVNSTLDSIKEFLSKHFEIISTFAMGSSIEDIQKAGVSRCEPRYFIRGISSRKSIRRTIFNTVCHWYTSQRLCRYHCREINRCRLDGKITDSIFLCNIIRKKHKQGSQRNLYHRRICHFPVIKSSDGTQTGNRCYSHLPTRNRTRIYRGKCIAFFIGRRDKSGNSRSKNSHSRSNI